jgi:actin-related protein
MVAETIKAVPIDLTRQMYSNIVVAGGTSLCKGFASRLHRELNALAPRSIEISVAEDDNRHLAVWRGQQ